MPLPLFQTTPSLFRAQIFLESTSRQDLHRAVSLWVQVLQQNRDGKIRWSVDVDAQEA